MTFYIAIIHKDPDSSFGVSFPDFPGCVTAGDTLEEAKNNAIEALSFHIEGMIEDGEVIPAPTTLDEINANPNFGDGAAILIEAATVDPVVRVNISLKQTELDAIDRAAKKSGIHNRSTYIVLRALGKLVDARQ